MTARRSMPAAAAPGVPAQCIGERYEVLAELGRGGTAVVHRVRDRSSGADLALKLLLAQSPERTRAARAQFEREFYWLAQLSHPSVVEVYEYGIDAGQPYYTMELLDGGDLSVQAPLPTRRACEIALQLCSTLSLLHSRALVHRDISPRNVRCTRDHRVKLIDFGALLPMGPCALSVGTPGFVAPEIVRHEAIDARTDLFSLGATLYFALTGRKPFAARSMAELEAVWRTAPAPPSRWAPQLPAALDALVLALLQLDRARRPQTAFEVMQRLCAIAGIPAEPEAAAQAYLREPPLIGRERELRQFRLQLRQASAAAGGCLTFEGGAGSGRTRLLQVCEIEAKLAGATVVHVSGRALVSALDAAREVAAQLLQQLPESARSSADDAGVADTLLERCTTEHGSLLRLRPVDELSRDHDATRAALSSLLRALCAQRTLVLAIDDLERVDDASLAWFVRLADEARGQRLLLLASCLTDPLATVHPALAVLRESGAVARLAALSAAQTQLLLEAVFFGADHVTLVSHRVHRLAAGNLRQSMHLAQHMLERGLVRYSDGKWNLPAELALAELPTSAEEIVRGRLVSLPVLARELATTQSLALEGPFTRSDYLTLGSCESEDELDDTLSALVQRGVLIHTGVTYTLTDLSVRAFLVSELPEADRARRHETLARLCALSARPMIIEAHHWLLAGCTDRGLERLRQVLDATADIATFYERQGVDRRIVADILERARALSIATGRPAREAHELSRRLLESSLTTGDAVYARNHAPWLARLELDSGLCDYQAADPALPASERLRAALEAAAARHRAAPERSRVYDPTEAIRMLALFVSISNVIAIRTNDTRLFARLPATLEPFAGLSPFIAVLLQITIAEGEMNCFGRTERARERMIEAYERLRQFSVTEVPFVETLRYGVGQAIAALEVALGYQSADHWITLTERHPLQRLGSLYLRRVLCVFDGDLLRAEQYRRQAELLAAETDGRGMLPSRLTLELSAHLHTGDLSGVKSVAERLAQRSATAAGWLAMHHVAQASFERLRGNLAAACREFERALAAADPAQADPPPHLNAWLQAAAGYATVLSELERAPEAHAFCTAALATCRTLELSDTAPLVRALALAEAKLADHASAAARIERLIEQRAPLRAAMLVPDYEARVLIAIWAADRPAAEQFFAAAQRHGAATAVCARLIEEAKQAGFELDATTAEAHAKAAGSSVAPADDPRVTERLVAGASKTARAHRALELLIELSGASGGRFYYRQADALSRAALRDPSHDPLIDRLAAGYFAQQLDRLAMTTVFTDLDDAAASGVGQFIDSDGFAYAMVVLLSADDACVGLVALRGVGRDKLGPEFLALSRAVAARLVELGDTTAA